jgi:hypothetical protein
MDFAASLALVTVVARARSALAGGLQGAPIQDHRTGLTLTLLRDPNYGSQITDHCLEAARVQLALRLLVDQLPWRKIGRQQTPRRTRPRHPAQRIEHLAQYIPSLWRIFIHQR